MEVLLLVIDISAMFLLVRWSARSETTRPDVKRNNPNHRRSQPNDDYR